MDRTSSIIWLRQQAFRCLEAASAWPDDCVRRRLNHLAEECVALSMDMESSMSCAHSMDGPSPRGHDGERIAAIGRP